MGKLIHHLTAFVLAIAPCAYGQSAESLKPGGIAQGKTTAESSSSQNTSAGPVSENPSRYAGADCAQYVNAISSVFAIRARNSDPFGMLQNPDSKPLKPKISRPTVQKFAIEAATPFSDIIHGIHVTAVMPGEKRFLVGDRSMASGDRFPLRYHEKSIRVQITSVTSSAILFSNLDTGESATLNLDVLPPGMSKGNNSLLAPGMISNRPDAPLEVELPNSNRPAFPGLNNPPTP